MKTSTENGTFTIFLEGKIHANNSLQFEKEIFDALKEYDGDNIIFDASKLTYISSAGLRMLLKIRQVKNKSIRVINASDDVYQVFNLTGFVDILEVSKGR